MKIIIARPSINSLGGAERLCILFARALKNRGHQVTLATLDKTKWILLTRVFADSFDPDGEIYLFSRMPEMPTLTLRQAFMALAYAFELLLITLKGKYDLLINMGGEILDSMGDVVYINAVPLRLMHVYPQIQPRPNVQWRCYSKLYSLATRVLRTPNNILVTNSKFNQDIIGKNLGRKATVVYPPVDSRRIQSLAKLSQKREDAAVTISRFRYAKGLERILEIAKRVENCKFILIGTADRDSEEYLKEMFERIEQLQLQTRIQIFVNKPFSFALEKLYAAKIFLHTQPMEAFGMSIVEAMAAGCVPVVPRDGGPWFDILDQKQGQYGYSYGSVEEAADEIRVLTTNEGLRKQIAIRATGRAMVFDSPIFENRIVDIVDKAWARRFR